MKRRAVPLAVDPTRSAWIPKAEATLRALTDVDGASIHAELDEILEVHIVTRSNRPAKKIVRDVQTVLATHFNRRIDHRIVSVASLTDPEPETPAPAPRPSAGPAPAPKPPFRVLEHDEREEKEPIPMPAPASDRVRYWGVNLFSSGLKTTAQVDLRWKGLLRTGSATGWSVRGGAHRLIAGAALDAVQEFLLDEVGLGVHDVEIVRLGKHRVAVVSISLLAHRQEKILVGTCAVEQDTQQAVVLATLSALNRIIGGLRTKEPTEYVLGPTST